MSAKIESGGRSNANKKETKYTHFRILVRFWRFRIPSFSRIKRTIGNWKPKPIKADVRRTTDKSLLISKIFPIPSDTEWSIKILICHFIIKTPKTKPIKNSNKERGMYLTIVLYSLSLKAGFRKESIS